MATAILTRSDRAAGICERHELMLQEDGSWRVRDTQGSGKWYTVIDGNCSCPDARFRAVTCKHTRAVLNEEQALADYCDQWNTRSEQARAAVELDELPGDFLDGDFSTFDDDVLTATSGPRCPQCGAPLDTRQYYVGGKGYAFFEVCARDAQHRVSAV